MICTECSYTGPAQAITDLAGKPPGGLFDRYLRLYFPFSEVPPGLAPPPPQKYNNLNR